MISGGIEAEDEPSDCRKFHCQPGQFQCDDHKEIKDVQCINPNLICDGKKDCDDGMDENKCDDYGCIAHAQFKCEKTASSSAYCINADKRSYF